MRRRTDFLALLLAVTGAACNRAEAAKTSAVGDSLKPFIVKNCETGQQYCQVCAYAGKPTLMAVRDVADTKLDQDLSRLQKIIDANKEKGVQAFAVVGKLDGKKLEPVGDEAKTSAELNEKRARLGVSFPVVVLASKLSEAEEKNYAKFSDAYALLGPRTIWLANAEGKIVYAEQIENDEAQFAKLEAAIKSSL